MATQGTCKWIGPHYQKYCYKMCPIRSGFSWTVANILSTTVHIILAISIIGVGLSITVQHEELLLIMLWIISSGSKPRPIADNRVYNQQWFVMRTASDINSTIPTTVIRLHLLIEEQLFWPEVRCWRLDNLVSIVAVGEVKIWRNLAF
jgi:hypothetical protein